MVVEERATKMVKNFETILIVGNGLALRKVFFRMKYDMFQWKRLEKEA